MGYDMYVCDDKGQTVEVDQPTSVNSLYLRRAIGSQGALRNALEEAGMGFWAVGYDDNAPWPKAPVGADGTPDYDDAEFQAAVHHRLTHSFDERPGIPLHKLCMNEGWWVTRVECVTALDLWERNGRQVPDGFRDDLLPFLAAAAKNGGFRVH